MTKNNPYTDQLIALLEKSNWAEPTDKQYPTYLAAYKKHGNRAKAPYFEDIHFIWRGRKEYQKKNLVISK